MKYLEEVKEDQSAYDELTSRLLSYQKNTNE